MNSLPEVRRFLKQPGGAGLYTDVSIAWIRGHDPTLYVYADGSNAVVESIKLAEFDFAHLHALFGSKFTKDDHPRSLRGVAPPYTKALHNDAAGPNPTLSGGPLAELAGQWLGVAGARRTMLLVGVGAVLALAAALATSRVRRRAGRTSSRFPGLVQGEDDYEAGSPRQVLLSRCAV